MNEPTEIYLIEQRRGPSKDGPWTEWSSEVLPKGAVMPRAQTCSEPLTEMQRKPRCMGVGYNGDPKAEVWQELRCIPFRRVSELVELEQRLARCAQDNVDRQVQVGELLSKNYLAYVHSAGGVQNEPAAVRQRADELFEAIKLYGVSRIVLGDVLCGAYNAGYDQALRNYKLAKPIPLLLHCPSCGKQHLDVLEDDGTDWATRPHRQHLCKNTPDGANTGCGHLWTPNKDLHTVGVRHLPGGE